MSPTLPLTPFTLFFTFLKAGGLTIGSGYATIQPMRRALVEKCAWMSEEDFAKHLAVTQAMPGIFNINLAAYLGYQLRGWTGSIVALMGMMLAPIAILLVFSTFFDDLRALPVVSAFLRGARPAIIALIILPCFQMWSKWRVTLSTVWIPIGAAIGIGLLGVSPTYIIIALALLGVLYGYMVRS